MTKSPSGAETAAKYPKGVGRAGASFQCGPWYGNEVVVVVGGGMVVVVSGGTVVVVATVVVVVVARVVVVVTPQCESP